LRNDATTHRHSVNPDYQTVSRSREDIRVPNWADLEAAEPELAEFGAKLLDRFDGLAYIGTVRVGDGAPRVHPVCVWRARGRLFLSVGGGSPKQHDLRPAGSTG
jgi:hypothetical protein